MGVISCLTLINHGAVSDEAKTLTKEKCLNWLDLQDLHFNMRVLSQVYEEEQRKSVREAREVKQYEENITKDVEMKTPAKEKKIEIPGSPLNI